MEPSGNEAGGVWKGAGKRDAAGERFEEGAGLWPILRFGRRGRMSLFASLPPVTGSKDKEGDGEESAVVVATLQPRPGRRKRGAAAAHTSA